MKRRTSQKGFTLIELLMVVTIVGILASIGVPMYLDYRARAYNTAAESDLKNFRTGMEAIFAENQRYPIL